MNQEDLQKQIDSRCPCNALPLNECDCQPETDLKALGIQQGIHCKCKGQWHIITCLCPQSLEEYLVIQGA